MRKVKIYEVKSGSVDNARKLLSQDEKYFYWNDAKFTNNEIGDIVFIINRYSSWAIFAEISEKDILTKFNQSNKTATFNTIGHTYIVNDPEGIYNVFIRFDVLEKKQIPKDLNWSKQLGQSETFDLIKSGLEGDTNRISKVDDLKKIFNEGKALNILNEAYEFLSSSKVSGNIIKPQNNHVTTNQEHISILTAIKTKPFILLAGLSGTGKSRLVRTLAYKTCAKQELRTDERKPGNFEFIPVRPNWHDSTELMGYVSRINEEKYITTTFLQFIAKAWKHTDIPFFLCLDEMNLAPVEQYFAEYLSIIETRQNQDNEIVTDYLLSKSGFENPELYNQVLKTLNLENDERFTDGIGIPANLIVIGTVNMDETTHSFSRKVLDRAMTFEMNVVDLDSGLNDSGTDWSFPEKFIDCKSLIGQYTAGSEVANRFEKKNDVLEFLKKINHELEGTPFKIAYRVRDEFLIYCYHASEADNKNADWLTNALDEMTSMKILSRIEGDETKTGNILRNLQKVLTPNYKKSNSKLREMEARLVNSGYTSFWS